MSICRSGLSPVVGYDIFEPLRAVGDCASLLDCDHRNGGRTSDRLWELRRYVCVPPSDARATAVDAPGLDIGVAKDINEACYRWLENAGLVERDDGGTDVGELQQAEAEEEEDITMFEDITTVSYTHLTLPTI